MRGSPAAGGGGEEAGSPAEDADVAAGENPVESPAVDELAPIGERIRERTRTNAARAGGATGGGAGATVAAHEPTPGAEAPGERANADAHAQGVLAALEPYVKRLAAGELEAVTREMESDDALRARLLALVADPELTALALDHARVRGARRELAERLLGRIGEAS